jgi:hypothetical protein
MTTTDYDFLKPYIGKIVVVPNPFVKWREEKEKYIYNGVMPLDARLRETVPGIIDLEYDYDEREESLKALEDTERLLQKDGYKYKVFDHGGRSPHLFIPVKGLDDIGLDIVKVYKKLFLTKYCGDKRVDESLTSTHLLALEYAAHWKDKYNGAIKQLSRSIGEGTNPIDEKLMLKARRITSQKRVVEEQASTQTLIIFKELLEQVQKTAFPAGQRNDVISKNIGIGLVQYGYNDQATKDIVTKYCEVQGIEERTVYGWIEKTHRGELQDFNVDEVIKYCYAYDIQLEGMEEFNKDKQHIQFPFELNWEQLKRISRRIYDMYDVLQLYTSDEKSWRGKVSDSPFKNVDVVNICKVCRSRARNTADVRLFFFDEPVNENVWLPNNEELQLPFYTYDFRTEYKSYTILSTTKLEFGEHIIKGNLIHVHDKRKVGYDAKLSVHTEIILVNSFESSIKKFANLQEVRLALNTYGIQQNRWFEWLFKSNEKQFKGQTLRHTPLFERLISAWLLSSEIHGYPLHLLVIARPGTGKTRLENAIHWKMDELEKPLEGGNSTWKALIPSFASKDKVNSGYLMSCNRVAIIDEFLRIVYKVRAEDRDEIMGELNTMLEHDEKMYSSAHANITARMRAKMLAVSNAIRGSGDINGLLEQGDHAAFSRFFVWYQEDEHIIRIQREEGIQSTNADMPIGDWLGVYDYMNSVDTKVDKTMVRKIFDAYRLLVPMAARDIYNARYFHHMQCLLDGLAKTRFVCGETEELEVVTQDIDDAKLIWRLLLKFWDGMSAKDWNWGGDVNILTSQEKRLYEIFLSREKILYNGMEDVLKEYALSENIIDSMKRLRIIKLSGDTNHYVLCN